MAGMGLNKKNIYYGPGKIKPFPPKFHPKEQLKLILIIMFTIPTVIIAQFPSKK